MDEIAVDVIGSVYLHVKLEARMSCYTTKEELRVANRYGIRLRPDLYEEYNPIKTRTEAEEKELTAKYRKKGYTVCSN